MNIRLISIIASLLIAGAISAQDKKVVQKNVDVRVEHGETTVTVKETQNGETTTKVMTGTEAEEYVVAEKAEHKRTVARASSEEGKAEVRVMKEVEIEEDNNGDQKEKRRYTYTTTGETDDVFVTDNEDTDYSSDALKMEVSDDNKSVSISCAPPTEEEATLTITGPGDKLIKEAKLNAGNTSDHTIDLKEHGTGDYTAKLKQGGTVIVKKLVIE